MEWQPIETAPKDGTYILVAMDQDYLYPMTNFKSKRVFSAYFQTRANDWVLEGHWAREDRPTHWMHLPEPPEAE